jgi:hypothetical protein
MSCRHHDDVALALLFMLSVTQQRLAACLQRFRCGTQREKILIAQYRAFCHTAQHKAELAALWRQHCDAQTSLNAAYAAAVADFLLLPQSNTISAHVCAAACPAPERLSGDHSTNAIATLAEASSWSRVHDCASTGGLHTTSLPADGWARSVLGASSSRSVTAARMLQRLWDTQRLERCTMMKDLTAALFVPSAAEGEAATLCGMQLTNGSAAVDTLRWAQLASQDVQHAQLMEGHVRLLQQRLASSSIATADPL